jgi:ribosomal protein L7Ae-like RNA K-turn-binding protein
LNKANHHSSVLQLLGLAYRARKISTGEDAVLRLLKQNKIKIVFVAKDASPNTIDQFDKKCYFYNTKMNNDYTCDELSKAVGKTMCKILAVTDQGFSDALMKYFGGAVNEG